MIANVFGKWSDPKTFEGQATNCSSTFTDVALVGIHEKYSITDEYILLRPGPAARASSPPHRCYTIYENT